MANDLHFRRTSDGDLAARGFAHGWGTVSCETHHSCAQGLIAKYKSGAGAWQDRFSPNLARGTKAKGCGAVRSLLPVVMNSLPWGTIVVAIVGAIVANPGRPGWLLGPGLVGEALHLLL